MLSASLNKTCPVPVYNDRETNTGPSVPITHTAQGGAETSPVDFKVGCVCACVCVRKQGYNEYAN